MIKGNGPCNAERMAHKRTRSRRGRLGARGRRRVRREAGRPHRGGGLMAAPSAGGPGSHRDWPLWEVFVRARRGLSHVHAGSLHAPDAEMALRNARDLYTRRGEGVSLWVVRASDIEASTPDERDSVLRPRGRQDLPPPDVLRRPRRGRAPLMSPSPDASTPRLAPPPNNPAGTRLVPWILSSTTPSVSPTTHSSRPSGWAGGSAVRRSSRRTSPSPTSASTSSARPARC